MQHSPVVKQLELDERISQQDIRIAYSDWLPQITSSANYQYYLKQPVIFLPNFFRSDRTENGNLDGCKEQFDGYFCSQPDPV